MRGSHAVEVEMRAIDEGNAHRCPAGADRVAYAADAGKRRCDGSRIAATGGDDVDVADDFAVPPDRARDLRPLHVRVRGDGREQATRLSERVREKHARAGVPKKGDPLENLFRRLRPEALELRKASVARRLLELVHRLESQIAVDLVDL